MLAGGGSRISHHFRHCPRCCCLCSGFGRFCTANVHFPLKPYFHYNHLHYRLQPTRRPTASSPILTKSSLQPPIVSFSFSQEEDHRELPSQGLSSVAGGIVALGKFDALHIGHRELAIQASKVGSPFLLSFVGMAEVLGWEPRDPIVAKCDRKRVLSSWASYCGNVAPDEFQIDFSSVRHLTPRQFVEKLSKELGVCGVVAGENYRFGYKAAGDASELVRLCEEYGMGAYIINSVMDKNANIGKYGELKDRGQVSSTRVRRALGVGDMKYVSELLGRRHHMILKMKEEEGFGSDSSKNKVLAPKSWLLNVAPKEGYYEECCVILSDERVVRCRVDIDKSRISLEMDEAGPYNFQHESSFLSIEFDCNL